MNRQAAHEIFQLSERDPSVLEYPLWDERYPWLISGFTTRRNGFSQQPFASFNQGLHVGDDTKNVLANRQKLTNLYAYDFQAYTCGEQVHGSRCHYVTNHDRGKGRETRRTAIPGVDALYTDEPGIMLISLYADCVPLFFVDPQQRIIGLAHAGWRGTVANIGAALLREWQKRFHSRMSDIQVLIGPSIAACCYEVDHHVIDQFPDQQSWIYPTTTGKYQIDLKRINANFLLEAGISTANIEISRWCTSCDNDLFFSYRKEEGVTGRMAAFMAINEEAKTS